MALSRPDSESRSPVHVPVLKNKVLKYLDPQPNQNFVDGTIGEGGHALSILKRNGAQGKVLGIDQDPEMLKVAKSRIEKYPQLKSRLILTQGNFRNLEKIVSPKEISPIHGVLLDLGMSARHLKKSGRGFSFQKDEPLDMRYDPHNPLRAKEIINEWSVKKLEKIFRKYGEEKFSKKIALEIAKTRKEKTLETTSDLVETIKKAIPSRYLRGRIHFATRTFQALRIAVNQELENLKAGLPSALNILTSKGRLVVISFHSLEDRIVKKFFNQRSKDQTIKILTKKPITPSLEEIKSNPSSRSAKLRAAQKLNSL